MHADLTGWRIGLMPIPLIYFHDESYYLPPIESRTSRPTGWMEISMKNLMLAAFAGDRRKFGGASGGGVFWRLFSDLRWMRGLDCEVGETRG